jgi:polar amino acid transport system substrate-binding protein
MSASTTPTSVLRIGSAFPDPPFNGDAAAPAGLDIDMMRALAAELSCDARFVPYRGDDFDGIFAGLGNAYDCVASGTTVTADREKLADFGPAYLVSGQALAVDVARHPGVGGVDDTTGMIIGVQRGNTSEPIARRLVAEGKAAAVRVYAYDRVRDAIADLSTGGCDAVMKLAPVLTELVSGTPHVRVVARGLSVERIAVATAIGDPLGERLARAQDALERAGALARLRKKWLGAAAREQT